MKKKMTMSAAVGALGGFMPKGFARRDTNARREHTYRAARRNLARLIRSNGGEGRSIPWPQAWSIAQQATAKKARAESLTAPEPAAPPAPEPVAFAPAPEPAPVEAPAPKKPRARKPAAPKPETETPKAPRKAAAKAPKPTAETKPKAAPRKRVVKPAA